MSTIKKDDLSRLGDQKPIQEQVMNRLTGMVISWSRHIAGQKLLDDAARELRCGVGGIADRLSAVLHNA